MIAKGVEGVEFIAANTDAQALKNVGARTLLRLGGEITKGLGAGANPAVGREAALEDRDRIAEVLSGADMVFVTAGMGGGTGTGGAPVVAEIARELGILTVAVVTRPFRFEKRNPAADQGILELQQHVDSLITIPNEKLLSVLGQSTTMLDAFSAANDVLLGAVQGIADLIIRPGMINVDFADVRTVMSEMGMAMMGTGSATGEDRARAATEAAIRSPLLEDIDLHGARGILVNVTAGALSIGEFTEVGDIVEEFSSDNATVVVGTVIDPPLTKKCVSLSWPRASGRRSRRRWWWIMPPARRRGLPRQRALWTTTVRRSFAARLPGQVWPKISAARRPSGISTTSKSLPSSEPGGLEPGFAGDLHLGFAWPGGTS